jgi:uncharacterized protein YdeI (YjbR/CyaY-like superfamily)
VATDDERTEPILALKTPAAWDRWLAKNHRTSTGALVRIAKGKESPLTYAEALDVALAWGWIDSQKKALDATHWLQRFTPRAARSPWSKINRQKAETLIAAGKMRRSGLLEVERAKADGRWERAYDGARASAVPDDFAAALDGNQKAKAFFATLRGANRYAFLYRIQAAKKPETRKERIARFVSMCAQHETIHPEKRKS